ncbi:NAD(P)-dependent oxidoreductase [Chloroflexota bacterium]
MHAILITEPHVYIEECISLMRELGKVEVRKLSREELLNTVGSFDIIMVGVETWLNQKVLEKAERLKIIGSPSTGLDHIDLEFAHKRGIKVVSLRGEREFLDSINATFEHTFALLLSLIRKIPWAFDAVRNEEWERNPFFGTELNGKTLGIIGLGRLGVKIARTAITFGMRVIAFDPYVDMKESGIERVDFQTLLSESDVVSIHVALGPEVENMISYQEFNLMQRKPILVNTSRGKLINEGALLKALENNLISGAAIDVLSNEFVNEPLKNNPLVSYARQHRNLIITPHLGGATCESMKATQMFVARKIREMVSSIKDEPS